jgi:hypothetical protein
MPPLQAFHSHVCIAERNQGSSQRVSTAFTLLFACVILASGLAIHDGVAARSLIEALAVVAIVSLAVSARAADVDFVVRATHGLAIPAAVPVIWLIIQLLPTSIGAHSIWANAAEAMSQHSWGHISIDLGRTILALSFYVTNVALILIGVLVVRDRRRAELILFGLTAITAITVAGLLVGKWGGIAGVNSSDETLSGVSALGILLSLTGAARAIERHESGTAKTAEPAENIRMAVVVIGAALIVDAVGLFASATTNVVMAVLFGIATFGSVQVIRRVGLGDWAVLTLIGTMLAAAAMIMVWRYDSSRALSPLLQFASAAPADAISMMQRMLSDSRWTGTGAGTFAAVLPIYRDLGSSVMQPPSTISGLAVELGLPMTFFVIALATWLVVMLYRAALIRGRDSYYPAAAAAGVIILTCEAFCDSSLLNAGVVVLGDALIGLGLAQRVSGRDSLLR